MTNKLAHHNAAIEATKAAIKTTLKQIESEGATRASMRKLRKLMNTLSAGHIARGQYLANQSQ